MTAATSFMWTRAPRTWTRHDLIEDVERCVLDACIAGAHPCVIDEDVDGAVGVDCRLDGPRGVRSTATSASTNVAPARGGHLGAKLRPRPLKKTVAPPAGSARRSFARCAGCPPVTIATLLANLMYFSRFPRRWRRAAAESRLRYSRNRAIRGLSSYAVGRRAAWRSAEDRLPEGHRSNRRRSGGLRPQAISRRLSVSISMNFWTLPFDVRGRLSSRTTNSFGILKRQDGDGRTPRAGRR